MSGAYRPGADAPEDAAEVLTSPPSAAPEDGPARPRRSRRRRRRPAAPADLADIADATGVRRPSPQPAGTSTAEPPAAKTPASDAPVAAAPAADPPVTAAPVTEAAAAAPVADPVAETTAAPEGAASPPPVDAGAAAEPADATGSEAPAAESAQTSAAGVEAADAAADSAVTPAVAPAVSTEDDDDEDDDLASSVRPYSWTRGRTRSSHDLQLETLVSTTDHGRDMAALTSIEHRAVAELCESARSVAEVAALLDLPLGVARVVVGDMAGLGLVSVHGGTSGDAPDTALMERVLSGLRRL